MKHVLENRWFFFPVAIAFAVGMVLVLTVPYGKEILFFNEFRHEPYNTAFQLITQFGEEWAYLVFGGAALFLRPRYALLIALVGLLSMPVGYMLKDAMAKDRPISYFEKNDPSASLVIVPGTQINRGKTSFPSGHTMSAFALYSLLTLMVGHAYRRLGLLFALIGILVGLSRIFLVQHFLVDVLAGALIGLFLGGFVWYGAARWLPKNRALPGP